VGVATEKAESLNMPYTTPEDVGSIIEVDESIDLTPFILTADQLVVELCVPEGYDDERLKWIETYLAAHCYTLRDPRPTSEHAGPVGESYQSAVDLLLYTSHYGQMAMMLDTGGALKTLSMKVPKQKLSVSWLGIPNVYRQPIPPFPIP
jgi:hypothetical protein